MLTRRAFLNAGGLALAGGLIPGLRRAAAAADVVEVRMRSDPDGAHVGFDPVGLLIRPGQTVRWVLEANVHTTTAYHPDNGGHCLRIPAAARPWDSGYLTEPGSRFEMTFTVEGTYDYFCAPHEAAGMVGRIIVGRPGGPGSLAFDYFRDDPAKRDWLPVPPAAQRAFPEPSEILAKGRVALALAGGH